MAGLRNNDCREVAMVAVPASDLVLFSKLIVVPVDFARLKIEDLTVWEVNFLDPLECGTNTIFLIVTSSGDQDFHTSREELSVHTGSVVLSVSECISHGAVGFREGFMLVDVQSSLELVKSVRLSE